MIDVIGLTTTRVQVDHQLLKIPKAGLGVYLVHLVYENSNDTFPQRNVLTEMTKIMPKYKLKTLPKINVVTPISKKLRGTWTFQILELHLVLVNSKTEYYERSKNKNE